MNRTAVNQQILDGKIHKAAKMLRDELVYPTLQALNPELDSIVDAYWSMIKFLAEGIRDEKREDVLCYLQRRLLAVSDRVYYEERKRNSGNQYYVTAKFIEAMPSLDEVFVLDKSSLPKYLSPTDRKTYDHLASQLFERIWVSNALSNDLAEKISASSEYLRMLMVSAMTLGLVQMWDFEKVRFVLNEIARPSISQPYRVRLAFALFMVFVFYPGRCELYRKELSELLAKADEVNPLAPVFVALLKGYLPATETERVTQTIERNLPDLIEASRGKRLEAILNDLEEDRIPSNDVDLKALEAKVNELGKLEEEGADTLYAAFRNVKQVPFFSSITAWFLPFDEAHSSVRDIVQEHEVLRKVLPLFGRRFCDSDLYSLVFGTQGMYMPINLTDDNAVQMLSQLEEQLKDPLQQSEEIRLSEAARGYIQDIYRFVKLYRGQPKSLDFFEKVVLPDLSLLTAYLPIDRLCADSALFLVSHKRYEEALPILEVIIRKNPTDAAAFAQLAEIYYDLGDYSRALELYEKSDLIEDLDKSSRLKLAHVFRRLGIYDKAIAIYEAFRENTQALLSLAATYIESERYEEALVVLHEYDYRAPHPSRAYRPIAWCLFVTGDYERSENYYNKIENPIAEDFLNKGYCHIARGELDKALVCYTEALLKAESRSNLMAEVGCDTEILLKKSIQPRLIYLLFDGAEMRLERANDPE